MSLRMRACIVSPHLDDAILSCGVVMQRLAAASRQVLGLSIFTAEARTELRKREDRLAMARIGATPLHLDELDAPDRDPMYRSLQQFFLVEALPGLAVVEGRVGRGDRTGKHERDDALLGGGEGGRRACGRPRG